MASSKTSGASGNAHLGFFEQYLVREDAIRVRGKARCSGCFRRKPKRWTIGRSGTNRMVMCEPCLRYMFGYDQAQALTIRVMIGAAVASLSDTGDHDLSEAAIAEALDDARTERVKVLDG